MRFIQNLSVESISLLERIHRDSQHHQVRQRAKCILLRAYPKVGGVEKGDKKGRK
jgi:hypothetical protein